MCRCCWSQNTSQLLVFCDHDGVPWRITHDAGFALLFRCPWGIFRPRASVVHAVPSVTFVSPCPDHPPTRPSVVPSRRNFCADLMYIQPLPLYLFILLRSIFDFFFVYLVARGDNGASALQPLMPPPPAIRRRRLICFGLFRAAFAPRPRGTC